MNKYQEALDKYENLLKDLPYAINYINEHKLLQELVDKEKPMKAVWKGTDSQGATFFYSYCPKCNAQVSKYTNKFCAKCGQKLDWSN